MFGWQLIRKRHVEWLLSKAFKDGYYSGFTAGHRLGRLEQARNDAQSALWDECKQWEQWQRGVVDLQVRKIALDKGVEW